MTWKLLVAVLSLLGLLLPLGSVLVGFVRVRRELVEQRRRLRLALEILGRPVPDGDTVEMERRRQDAEAVLPQSSTWNHVSYMREVIAEAVLESNWEQLRWPAFWAAMGLVCSTAASLLPLCVDL